MYITIESPFLRKKGRRYFVLISELVEGENKLTLSSPTGGSFSACEEGRPARRGRSLLPFDKLRDQLVFILF
jgi:hypothetical protein